MEPQFLDNGFVDFIDKNLKANPGNTFLKFNVIDSRNNLKVALRSFDKGFTMNDDLAVFLNENKDIEVSVVTG